MLDLPTFWNGRIVIWSKDNRVLKYMHMPYDRPAMVRVEDCPEADRMMIVAFNDSGPEQIDTYSRDKRIISLSLLQDKQATLFNYSYIEDTISVASIGKPCPVCDSPEDCQFWRDANSKAVKDCIHRS